MSFREVYYNEVLPSVERPSRYLGTEWNAVHKRADEVALRVALVFPDLYDLGLGNLGLLVLYAILNDLPWCWAERAYAPAPDMERALRERGLPLFTSESKDPLGRMDLIGFTLQSELTYTNVLTVLDLARIPLRATDRSDAHPLIAAGGPSTFNPEPMAPFMDFMVIGDGEEAIVEIAALLRDMKGAPRPEKLEALARLEGVYVPGRYPVETLDDGRIVPREDAPKVVRRVVRDLDAVRFPTDYIVPFTQQVHDRVALEVLRGCTHGCRFCQAGMATRPVRERSLETIDRLMDRTLASTGYEEISLLSLSTCDYSRVRTMLERAAARATPDGISVSLPSLRLDTFSVELADRLGDVRRTGLTFAPEAATPRLRAVINKWIPDDELLEVAAEAYRRGWGHIKLYFMIGLPTESDEDVHAIVDLCTRVLHVGRRITSRARVHTGVSTFVPKPLTPFQWAEQISMDEARRIQALIKAGLARHHAIKFGRHSPESTFIEGLLSRADRRAADLIEAAWRRGARFESWDEHLDLQAWLDAIDETGYDVAAVFRARGLDERFPWDHVDSLVSNQWLRDEWRRAMALERVADCRYSACSQCGVIERERELCLHIRSAVAAAADAEPGRAELPLGRPEIENDPTLGRAELQFGHPEIENDPTPGRVALPRDHPVPPAQRLRFRIGRTGEARFLSHLELMTAWIRALRRAKAPVAHSQGFHAHPKVTFSAAPPVGEESQGDYMDIVLRERVEPQHLLDRLRTMLPQGFSAFQVAEVPLQGRALMDAVCGFSYTLRTTEPPPDLDARIAVLLAADTIEVQRGPKPAGKAGAGRGQTKPKVTLDVRPFIVSLSSHESSPNAAEIKLDTRVVQGRSIRPRDLIALLGLDPLRTRVIKRATDLVGAIQSENRV